VGQANSQLLNAIFFNELKDLAHFPEIASQKNVQQNEALRKHTESATSSLHMGFFRCLLLQKNILTGR
jgi:hypothetical protein